MSASDLSSYAEMELLNQHWAVSAIPKDLLRHAHAIANERVVINELPDAFVYDHGTTDGDDDLIRRASAAYEIAAAESIRGFVGVGDQKSRTVATLAALSAYDLSRALPIVPGSDDEVLHFLTLAALAYLGNRETDLWARVPDIKKHKDENSWDKRILSAIYDCWIRILRKNGWDDLHEVASSIGKLRDLQPTHEPQFLDSASLSERRPHAFRLLALYNWARATELLARYMLQGDVSTINTQLDQFFENAELASLQSGDAILHSLLRWLFVAAKRMVSLSIWNAATQSDQARRFVESLTRARALFELLPPQRAALLERGILDPAKRAIVIDMPTSSGKTLLAEFRIIQTLVHFGQRGGWVAYVAPTKALVSQVARRLRADLGVLGINIEELSGAVDVDALEQELLTASHAFDVLVCTPEKLATLLRRQATQRPLGLVVLDEAHNITDPGRGLRIELLLATIKREQQQCAFMLLMPNVPNASDLAAWLADDERLSESISFGAVPWRPNDVLIGRVKATKGTAPRDWGMEFETMIAPQKSLDVDATFRVKGKAPLNLSWSKVRNSKGRTAGAASMSMSAGQRVSVCLLQNPSNCWSVARDIAASMDDSPTDDSVELVCRYLATEISPNFELISMLRRGVAVHHSGLSDETRFLIEWLVEARKIRVLCATWTIAQGINFPISSVNIASLNVSGLPPRPLTYREFWNLAGRTGRVGQEPVGVVGIVGEDAAVDKYLKGAADDLISRLEDLAGALHGTVDENLVSVIQNPDWEDFRSYVAHLCAQRDRLDMAAPEQLLRNTLGYTRMIRSGNPERASKARQLLELTRRYAGMLSSRRDLAKMADATGFSPEGVRRVLAAMATEKFAAADWRPESLFDTQSNGSLTRLIGVMLQLPQLRDGLKELAPAGHGGDQIARVAAAWVGGTSIEDIARTYFASGDGEAKITEAITNATKGIYRALAYAAPWGLSALSHLPSNVSGINFEQLSDQEKRLINMLPAMLYYGVSTEEAVAMRVNAVPRTVAPQLGERFKAQMKSKGHESLIKSARKFVQDMSASEWESCITSKGAQMSGSDYQMVWKTLTGYGA